MASTRTKTNKAGGAAVGGGASGAAGGAAAPSMDNLGLDDFLNMAAEAAAPAAKTTTKDADRSRLPLPEEYLVILDDYVYAKVIGGLCGVAEKNNGARLKDVCLRLLTDQIWRTKTVPENPEIVTFRADNPALIHNRAIFQIKATFRPNHVIPKPENRPPGVKACTFLFESLTTGQNPISAEHANLLMDNEVVFEKSIGINDLNELANGRLVKGKWVDATDAEKAVVQKFMKMLFAKDPAAIAKQWKNDPDAAADQWVFTADERRLLMRQDDEVIRMRDSEGFLARVVQYVSSADQLRHVIVTMKPELAISGIKFAENSSVDETPRLAAAERILHLSRDTEPA